MPRYDRRPRLQAVFDIVEIRQNLQLHAFEQPSEAMNPDDAQIGAAGIVMSGLRQAVYIRVGQREEQPVSQQPLNDPASSWELAA